MMFICSYLGARAHDQSIDQRDLGLQVLGAQVVAGVNVGILLQQVDTCALSKISRIQQGLSAPVNGL